MRLAVKLTPLVIACAAAAAGCASDPGGASDAGHGHHAAQVAGPWAGLAEAVAVVRPTQGNRCAGVVHFADDAAGVRVVGEFEGLTPNAKHAFHIHEFGDARGADGKNAGAHYNPGNHPHAGPDAAARHAGDLGNIEADASGRARYERLVVGITVAGDVHPILGRSVVVHAKEDDLATQPTGNAGDRIGVGVIGVARPAGR
jgi:Cu-Zn family superoxide dismutase